MWQFDENGVLVFIPTNNGRVGRLMSRVFRENEDGGNGGGSGGNPTPTLEELQAQLAAANESINGLKTNNQNLLNEKKNLANVAKTLESVGGVDGLTSLLEFKSKIEQDEILKLAMDGKPQEAIEKATERMKLTHAAELQDLKTANESTANELKGAKDQLRKLIVDNKVSTEFLELKGPASALVDVLTRANSVFTVENGEPVARDAQGNLIPGKTGALTVKEWVEGLRATAPHLFPTSTGAGIVDGKSTKTEDFDALKAAAAKEGPEALRKEKARQKAILEGKKQ